VPELDGLLCQASRVLRPQGLLAFTVETHRGDGVILGEGLRYVHSEAYLCGALVAAGLISCIAAVSTRIEAGEDVPGLVVTASRHSRHGMFHIAILNGRDWDIFDTPVTE
jgi:predicted TPR repeat methyltransferase